MPKEDIREGMQDILGILYNFHLDGNAYANKILDYLRSQGVVRKVEGELPEWVMEGQEAFDGQQMARRFKEAGYVKVEEL